MKHFSAFCRFFILVSTFSFLLLGTHGLMAQAPDIQLSATPVITGLTAPMQLVHAGDQSGRIFIAERAGVIKVFNDAELASGTVYLNMNALEPTVGQTGEGGLLSIAFHPAYKSNGYVYAYYTDTAGDLVLARYTAPVPGENSAAPSSRLEILKIPHPVNTNHNGGEIHFGYEDGLLYLSTGDGGGGNDVNQNAQNPTVLLGKILRIDVNSASATTQNYAVPLGNPFSNEVFAFGLRNPFRWSFDRVTHDMWIGDVGQGSREEINHRTASETSGTNYGWRCFEGDIATPGIDRSQCGNAGDYTAPVYTYPTGNLRGRSVIGGVVYRGTAFPMLYGYYIGMDYTSGDIHKIASDESVKIYQTSTYTGIVDIGEDERGEIYAVGGGSVYSISASDPLPVMLVSLTANSSSEGVGLKWETTRETNFLAFDVEFSMNAVAFNRVGTVLSQSNAKGSTYEFSHVTAEKGMVYYRLKLIDTDGSFVYSRMISINTEKDLSTDYLVRPSLISDGMLHIFLDNSYSQLELTATNGNVLLQKNLSAQRGEVNVPVDAVVPGMYILRLSGNGNVVQQKILIVK